LVDIMSVPIALAGQDPELFTRVKNLLGPKRAESASTAEFLDAARLVQGGEFAGLQPILDAQGQRQERLVEKMEDVLLKRGEQQQKFGKESLAEAAKYNALFNLPGTIMSAVSTPGIIAAQGAGNIANIMTQGAQNIPALTRFERGSYSYTPTRYFG
jgi:hypothetical protein